MPALKSLNYQKAKQFITRVDHARLKPMLEDILEQADGNCFALVERPFTGTMGKASLKTVASGMRACEAVLIMLEILEIPYQFTDSKGWQKELLPKGLVGSAELKSAGKDVAKRMWPGMKFKGDADGILIAEYARRKQL